MLSSSLQRSAHTQVFMSVRQTFETFLELPPTTAALHMCRRVADDALPAGVLLLHGPTGSGKTHLLHAVASAARRRCACRLVETRAMDFVAGIVRELTWRDAPRAALSYFNQLDLLVADDLQWLAGKSGSQHAVAQLFRQMAASGATVVCARGIAAQALPNLLSVLESATAYREIELTRPSKAEVTCLVRHLGDLQDVALSQETVSLIAERCGGDIGRAHGLVAQFAAAVRYSTRGAAAAALARVCS
jgi:chromosomal replication initiator protein